MAKESMFTSKNKMATITGGSLKLGSTLSRCLQVTQVRFRRIQSRNPPEPHYDRKAMITACKPIVPPTVKVCGNIKYERVEREPHPYNVLRAQKLRTELEEAKMILFFHKNPIKAEEDRLIYNMLFKKEFFLKRNLNNETMRLAIQDSKFANAYPFAVSQNALVLSPNADIKGLLRLTKKMPQYILLAGIIDNTFLSREQLQWLSTVPDISAIQSQTCGILSYHASNLSRNLSSHTQRLSRLLTSYAGESPSGTPAKSESSSEPKAAEPAKPDEQTEKKE